MAIDLHIHTTASDGIFTPSQVVEMAKEVGLTAIGITDHDTMGGVEEALKRGSELGLEIVPGIELNTDYKDREIHVLGYYLDYRDSALQIMLRDLQDTRINRAKKMVDKLNQLGVNISYERVLEIAGEGSVGRPHLAQAIVEQGFAVNWEEVFARYIGKDCPAYVPRTRLTPFSAVELILEMRGIPVLAHPGLNDIDEIIPELIQVGLRGIEVFHYEHTLEDQERYLKIAQTNGLLITGGSDFHGPARSPLELGDLKLSTEYLIKLKEAREGNCD